MTDYRGPKSFAAGWRAKAAAGLTGLALILSLGAGTAALVSPATAHAQLFSTDDDEDDPTMRPTDTEVWDAKKLQKLDRNVRKLQRTIARLEGKTPNPPILIEPDPEVVALQATVDILSRKIEEQTAGLTRLTGQLEETQFQNRELSEQVSALLARVDTLTKRVDLNDAHIKDIDAALAPPPPPPPTLGDAQSDFERAYNMMTSGQTGDAERAFEGFTTTWPEASQLPEAWFRLGQLRAMKQDNQGAIAAYATALKGWPKAAWAPEATVRLAGTLTDTNRPTDACATLGQFDKLYAKTATAESKSLAKSLKVRAKCKA